MTDLPTWVSEALICPVTGEKLHYSEQDGGCFVTRGVRPEYRYPIRDGIPVLLADEAIVTE